MDGLVSAQPVVLGEAPRVPGEGVVDFDDGGADLSRLGHVEGASAGMGWREKRVEFGHHPLGALEDVA